MKKLIVRTDDVGYTEVHDIGVFETYDRGYSTSADVMLDSPGTVAALKRLKNMPWVSIGWHAHFWNSPVLDTSEVKSMVIPGTNRFRLDVKTAMDVDYNEALAECRTQLKLCMDILGKAPDVGGSDKEDTPFARAVSVVTKEYGMVYDFGHRIKLNPDGTVSYGEASPKWDSKHIYLADNGAIGRESIIKETLRELEDYDAVGWLLRDTHKLSELPEDAAVMHGFHPGYVDYYVARLGDPGPYMRYYTLSRTYDVEGLCSQRLHDWIKENNIELCNLRDALYGTHEYQNHLRNIGSDLCVY